MIPVDANLPIYASVQAFPQHERARRWLGERHRELLGQVLGAPGVQANLVQDAHLATLAIEHGLILCSTDGDFGRFAGLRWENPLHQPEVP